MLNSDFYFSTKFPLGKTGRSELVTLLRQIDGDEDPFSGFSEIGEFDSALFLRHSIVHQDRFFGTNTSVKRNIEVVKKLVEYIDNYLNSKMI